MLLHSSGYCAATCFSLLSRGILSGTKYSHPKVSAQWVWPRWSFLRPSWKRPLVYVYKYTFLRLCDLPKRNQPFPWGQAPGERLVLYSLPCRFFSSPISPVDVQGSNSAVPRSRASCRKTIPPRISAKCLLCFPAGNAPFPTHPHRASSKPPP